MEADDEGGESGVRETGQPAPECRATALQSPGGRWNLCFLFFFTRKVVIKNGTRGGMAASAQADGRGP